MATYNVVCHLHCASVGDVDLGERTWDEVADWRIKWDTLHVKFKGEEDWHAFELNSCIDYGVDWKHPLCVSVYPEDDYDTLVDEMEN